MILNNYCPNSLCFHPLEVDGETILDNGHPVTSCPECNTPIIVLFGTIVTNTYTAPETVKQAAPAEATTEAEREHEAPGRARGDVQLVAT